MKYSAFFKITIFIVFTILILSQLIAFYDKREPLLKKHDVVYFKRVVDIKGLSLFDRDLNLVNITDSSYKLNILLFWADWCRYCAQEMPYLDKFYNLAKENGYKIVPILEPSGTGAKVDAFFAKRHINNLKTFYDYNADFFATLAIKKVPTFILVNEEGFAFASFYPKWNDDSLIELFDKIYSSIIQHD